MRNFSGNDSIRAKIRGYQLTSGLIRQRCEKSSGDEKHELKLYKKQCGQEARHHLVALGLLRGFRYDKIEQNCSTTHLLNKNKLLDIMNAHREQFTPGFSLKYVCDLLDNCEPTHVFTCATCNKSRLPRRVLGFGKADMCQTCWKKRILRKGEERGCSTQ